MDISVITVNYYSTALINEYERRLAAMHSCELIVVDNSGNYESLYENTKIVKPEGNLGFGRGSNLGAKIASGHVLIFLNPDTDLSTIALEKLAASCRKQSRSITGPILLNSSNRFVTLRRPGKLGLAFTRVDITNELPTTVGSIEVVYVTGACLALTAKFFKELGGFADDIFLYGEDLELCLRAWNTGGKVFIDTSIKGFHVGGGSSNQPKQRIKRLFRSIIGHYRAMRKVFSPIFAAINAVHLASGIKV